MKRIIIAICVIASTAFCAEKVTPTTDGNVIIRATATSGVYSFTNSSAKPLSLQYVRVLSSGEVDGVATSTYSRVLSSSTVRTSIVETNYAGGVETNWAFAYTNSDVSWTNTITNAVTGLEFNIDLNDKIVLLLDEVYTLAMPATTNTYYLDIHAVKE